MQVCHNGIDKFGFTALGIDVFDPQQGDAVERSGGVPGGERRIGVAEMQQAIGTGCKAKDGSV